MDKNNPCCYGTSDVLGRWKTNQWPRISSATQYEKMMTNSELAKSLLQIRQIIGFWGDSQGEKQEELGGPKEEMPWRGENMQS